MFHRHLLRLVDTLCEALSDARSLYHDDNVPYDEPVLREVWQNIAVIRVERLILPEVLDIERTVAVCGAFAVLIAVLSVLKRRRLKRKFSVARQHLQSGDLLSALWAYVEAESDWADMAGQSPSFRLQPPHVLPAVALSRYPSARQASTAPGVGLDFAGPS